MADPTPITNTIRDILSEDEAPPEWLVENMFLQGTLICLAGAPGAGKSYLSYTIALAIASGMPALSGLVPASDSPKRVLYFDEENSKQDRNKYIRRSWMGLTKDMDPAQMSHYLDRLEENFWPLHYHLGGADWEEQAALAIDQIQPHLAVFDTATPSFAIEDENDNAEATKVIRALQELRTRCVPDITMIVLKHAKLDTDKGQRRTMRGAKAWLSAADQTMFQVKTVGRPLKSGLSLTRLEPDKVRAYGLTAPLFITPAWTDDDKSGLALEASYDPSREHRQRLKKEDGDDDEE